MCVPKRSQTDLNEIVVAYVCTILVVLLLVYASTLDAEEKNAAKIRRKELLEQLNSSQLVTP